MQISKFAVFAVTLALFPAVQGGEDFFPAGNFESGSYAPLHIRRFDHTDGKRIPLSAKSPVKERIQNEMAFSGSRSLLLETDMEGSHELNVHNCKWKPGKKYEFSYRYYIAKSNPKFGASGRVIFEQTGQKPRYHFPNGSAEPGKWHQLKVQFYPPAGTEKGSVTVWIGKGPYKVYIDDLKAVELETGKSIIADSNTVLLKSGDVTIWKQSNYRRVDSGKVPEGLKTAATVELTAAANEQEPFQLALFPQKELKKVTAVISDLKGNAGVIPASAQSFGILRYIPMRNPDNPTLKGEIADPIVPDQITDAPANKNTTFFIRIMAPKGTKAGVYQGTVTLKAEDKVLAVVPVKLTVRNFELPEIATMRTFFYGNPGNVKRNYGDKREWKEIADDFSQIFKNHRITGDQCIKPTTPKFNITGSKLTVTDWSEFDKRAKELYEKYNVRSFTTPLLSMSGDNGGWFGGKKGPRVFGKSFFSQEARDLAGDYAKQFDEHWRKTMPADAKYYCYIYDEPAPKVYKELNKFMEAVKKKAPNFRFYTPHKVDPDLPYFTVFAVPFGFGYVNPQLEKNVEHWYYNWTHPLDHTNYIKNRLYAWQIYANGGEGGLTWETCSSPKDVSPWTDLEKCHSNGAATTIYPALTPGGKFVPSLRLAQIREAMDDCDYLKILENKVEKAFPGKGKEYVLGEIKDLITQLPFGFTNDAELLYKVRARIGDAIEKFNPKFLVLAQPANHTQTEVSRISLYVHAPLGSNVVINGKKAGVIEEKNQRFAYEMTKIGLNPVAVTVSKGKETSTFNLAFTLKQDPNIAKLEKLAVELSAHKLNTLEIGNFLRSSKQGSYTESDRTKCAELLASATQTLIKHRLDSVRPGSNALVNAMQSQAKLMYENKLYARAAYYLNLADEFAQCKLPANSKLKIVPVNICGNQGFRISNGLVEFTLLELGGRIISFKVKGVETLSSGNLAKTLPLDVKAGKKYHTFSHLNIPSLGGYEDAEKEVLPESSVDWDLAVKEISPRRIAIEAKMLMRGDKFQIARIMSIVPGKPELKIDYTISNVYPAEFKSDDPSHYYFHWRGRLCPKIGENYQFDRIEVPTEMKLQETLFDVNKPVFYEARSVPLTKPQLGVSNAGKKIGLTWQLDPSMRYGYLWFNSKGDHNGKHKMYTLEVFRSFYGNKPGIPGNKPFSIEPGKSVNFSISFIGRTL